MPSYLKPMASPEGWRPKAGKAERGFDTLSDRDEGADMNLSTIAQVVEQSSLSLDNANSSLDEFVIWLRTVAPIPLDAISSRRLRCAYAEFCDLYDLPPLSTGRFNRALKPAGFVRLRSNAGSRPWFYRLPRLPGDRLEPPRSPKPWRKASLNH